MNGFVRIQEPRNEPVLSYLPGSSERDALKVALRDMAADSADIPCIIGGREIRTGRLAEIIPPHERETRLGVCHLAGEEEARLAIQAAQRARADWAAMDWVSRAAIMLRAAQLLSGKYRMILNAATMLGQSKNPHQAEIDSACELVDFWRFNPWYMSRMYDEQPISTNDTMNMLEQRPLEGFVFAITPFNFTSIAGNLPTAPALMGNTVIWKPASSALLSAYWIMKLLKEAGFPDGVINMLPGPGGVLGPMLLTDPHLAGVHFTGSTGVFADIWKTIGADVLRYRSWPRLVGETGGKDFIFAHTSADQEALVAALIRGAFEYQGQKCSAVSRAYIPRSLWPSLRERLLDEVATIRMGDVNDFSNFMNAVIDRGAFRNISSYIEHAKADPGLEILTGGGCDDSRGWFIQPTVVFSQDPRSKLMVEEIFGPVLTLFIYPDAQFEETLRLCDETSPYALTGAIFARERSAVNLAGKALIHAAGNFYINDKPSGAVVGQQPFGGSRASGTNDKAGSMLNLSRWVTPRAIKENLTPPEDYRYPFMESR